jgi:hypothetical protein
MKGLHMAKSFAIIVKNIIDENNSNCRIITPFSWHHFMQESRKRYQRHSNPG